MLRALIIYLACDLARDIKLEILLVSDDKSLMDLLLLESQHVFWALTCMNTRLAHLVFEDVATTEEWASERMYRRLLIMKESKRRLAICRGGMIRCFHEKKTK